MYGQNVNMFFEADNIFLSILGVNGEVPVQDLRGGANMYFALSWHDDNYDLLEWDIIGEDRLETDERLTKVLSGTGSVL